MQNNPSFEVVYTYDVNVLQSHLFVAGGEIMMIKVIASNGDNKSSTLELCSLNDTLVNFKSQKKNYAFVMKLIGVIPLHAIAIMYLLFIMMTDFQKLIWKYFVSLYLHVVRIYIATHACS